MSGCRDTNRETTTANGWYDLRSGIGAENDAAGGHVFLHGATQAVLCLLAQLIGLGEHHHCLQELDALRTVAEQMNQGTNLNFYFGHELKFQLGVSIISFKKILSVNIFPKGISIHLFSLDILPDKTIDTHTVHS